MPHFITTHSINNPNYIKMQQNKNQQLDAKFRKFIKVLIMAQIQNFGFEPYLEELAYLSDGVRSDVVQVRNLSPQITQIDTDRIQYI